MDAVTAVAPRPAIAEFATRLAEAVTARGGAAVPEKSRVDGHMVSRLPANALDEVEQIAVRIAKSLDLVEVTQRQSGGLRVAAFSPAISKSRRAWALADLETGDGPRLFAPPPPREAPALSAWRVARGVRYEEPALFTVMGPEGVGKTTLCNNLIRIFSGYPMPFRQIHHTAEWKGGSMADPAMREARAIKGSETITPAKAASNQGRLRAALRAVLPGHIRRQIGSFLAELAYMRQLSAILARSYFAGELVISDRYCYDRLVRWRNLGKPLGQRLASKLVCRTMRRPLHAFLLFDEPERIHARKQIMPCWEIEQHQSMLITTCEHFGVSFEVVRVTEMKEDLLAEFVARRILTLAGTRLFPMIDAGFAAISRVAISSTLGRQR